jgi:hypothetical protein
MSLLDGTISGYRGSEPGLYPNLPAGNDAYQFESLLSPIIATEDIVGEAADTYLDTAATVALTAGTWLLTYKVLLFCESSSATLPAMQVAITDSLNNVVIGSEKLIFGRETDGVDRGSGYGFVTASVAITIGSGDTYKLRVRKNSNADTAAFVYGANPALPITAGNSSYLQAIRL